MRYHHTKTKGDLGAVHVMADMAEQGYRVLVPLSEHEAFDFVAYRDDRFVRVQAKYRAAVRGVIIVPFKTCWADVHGVHTVPIDRQAIDLVGIYCPDTAGCYYVDPRRWPSETINLRISPPKNNMKKGIRMADDHRAIPASVAGMSGGFGNPLVLDASARHSSEPRAQWLS